MEVSDFKEIIKEHFESCREIIEQDGGCNDVDCLDCPFWYQNWNHQCCEDDISENLSEYAKEFIEKFKKI